MRAALPAEPNVTHEGKGWSTWTDWMVPTFNDDDYTMLKIGKPRPTTAAEAETANFEVQEKVSPADVKWDKASLWKHKSLGHVVLWFGELKYEGLLGGYAIAYDPLTQALKQDELPHFTDASGDEMKYKHCEPEGQSARLID